MNIWQTHTERRLIKLPDMRPHLFFIGYALIILFIVLIQEHTHPNAFWPLLGMGVFVLGGLTSCVVAHYRYGVPWKEVLKPLLSADHLSIYAVFCGVTGVLLGLHYPFYIAWYS